MGPKPVKKGVTVKPVKVVRKPAEEKKVAEVPAEVREEWTRKARVWERELAYHLEKGLPVVELAKNY